MSLTSLRRRYLHNVVVTAAALLTLQLPQCATTKVELSPVSTTYLPSNDQGLLEFGSASVGKIVYSAQHKLIYAAGKNMLHVINVAEPAEPEVELSKFESEMEFAGIAECNDLVFVTVRNMADRGKGQFRVYSGYVQGFQLLAKHEVGANPGDVIVREDCKSAVISLEGEPYVDGTGSVVDPEGEVLIAKFPEGVTDNGSVKIMRIDFGHLNDHAEKYEQYGARFVSKHYSMNSTFSQDLEPENAVIDEFEDTLYVTLQENNAIAEIDLWEGRVTHIHGLGSKKWGYLDASDKDGGAQITYWPIRAWYQPSGIQFYQWKFMKLLITANQGSARHYEQTRDISQSDLASTVPDIIKQGIEDDKRLGRLQMSARDGKNAKDKYSKLYTFGGRSFTIWTISGGPLMRVFDSDSQIEERTAKRCPHLFNRDVHTDDRSDDMGPEPNTIAVGEIDDHLFIFIGIKHPGTIFVYKLGNNLKTPSFQTVFCHGIPVDETKSYKQMYEDHDVYTAGVKDLK
ncbi:mesenchyme-specific cell surface glycoprotein [Plakobranchus ocellatus]|uniref:Mesenchyme-specific cell surface glycoprotein n=1 Tax=Plakobranchus ocellatus TaxID=259542 RepID=A0AAV4CCW5_9GAST|nr:mesenchyme-specific cell surface glycoprotein [Plakobranchus ocellatus]